MKSSIRFIIHFALLIVSLIYGANYSILKVLIPEYMPAFGFIFYRILAASILFWLLSSGNKEKVNWKKDGGRLVLCALFGVATNQLLFFKGVSITSAINGSIIMTLTPVFVFILSAILLNEKITKTKIVGLIVAFVGALSIIYQPETVDITVGNWVGDVLVLLNALSYGTYLVLVKPLMGKYSPLTVTRWVFSIGFILATPVSIQEALTVDWSTFEPEAWWSGIYVILGVTVIAYLVNAWSMKRVNPTLVGIYIYLQPVFASLIAVTFFQEDLTMLHILSALLVFSGIYLVSFKKRRFHRKSRS